MTDHKADRLELQSMDVRSEQRKKLKKLFPEVFCQDRIDWTQFKNTLGEDLDSNSEKYFMSWPGKKECFHTIQDPCLGTLRPCKSESIDWETTENLFIEGENLEVLKLLQHAYFNKVKMIYIDPPYNTGKDFIYPDRYKEALDTYLRYTGQKNGAGQKVSTHQEVNGRFHSKWLNMMYPRLFLAKNLLREDGVIFISIDDNEVTNLRKICDEIFGEENFITQCAWRKTDNQANIGNIARVKEYIIGYTKNIEHLSLNKMRLTERAKREYRYSDEKGHYRRAILLHKTRGKYHYKIKTPSGDILDGPWMKSEDEFQSMVKEGKIHWAKAGQEQPYGKIYLQESRGQIANDFLNIEYGTNQQGSLEVEHLFNGRYFDFPKPLSLIKHFITISTANNDLVLDFFAGSATTAHAVMQLNVEDGGNRKYICVQLPEPLQKDTEAYKAGYKNIADISKERIRRAIKKIKEDHKQISFAEDQNSMDLGFKVFKLDKSNFKVWEDISKDKKPSEQIEMYLQDFINSKSSDDDLLYEILIKTGCQLTTPIQILKLAGKTVYSVEDQTLLICLDRHLTEDLFREMGELKPARVVCLDIGFKGVDALMTNAWEIFKYSEVKDFQVI